MPESSVATVPNISSLIGPFRPSGEALECFRVDFESVLGARPVAEAAACSADCMAACAAESVSTGGVGGFVSPVRCGLSPPIAESLTGGGEATRAPLSAMSCDS